MGGKSRGAGKDSRRGRASSLMAILQGLLFLVFVLICSYAYL